MARMALLRRSHRVDDPSALSDSDSPLGTGPWTSRRGAAGQALVEMALLVPSLLLIVLLAVDFGRAFYDYERLTNAAREGAMWIARNPAITSANLGTLDNEDENEHIDKILARVRSEGGTCSGGAVTLDGVPNPGPTTAVVAVKCQFQLYSPIGSLIGASESNQITLRSQASMPR
ncbi:MAG: TadE/TadG family type IV pilus assembly protein [Bacteroidota bacterium]